MRLVLPDLLPGREMCGFRAGNRLYPVLGCWCDVVFSVPVEPFVKSGDWSDDRN